MSVSRLPFAIEDLKAEIIAVSGNENAAITITLDGASFGPIISELNSHQGYYAVIMHPGYPPEHRYNGISIVRRESDDEPAAA